MENYLKQSRQSSGDYYPHYSLFQRSLFYDTDNIRIAFLTCKYDSLTTESGIRTFEYRKSSAELDDCRTESKRKCSEDLACYTEPTAQDDVGGQRRRSYSRIGPKWCEDLTHSIEPPDKKDIKSCGTLSGPKDLALNAEPLDIEGGYTLFRPNWSDNLVRSIEPPDTNDIKSCATVYGPKDLAHNTEPLDKEAIEGGYSLFRPNWSDNLLHSTEPPDKKDIESCYTLFGPKRSDKLLRSIEPLNKKDLKSCTVSGPKWSDLVGNAELLVNEDIDTMFGPKQSDIEKCRTVSEPMWPVDLACNVEPPDKENVEGWYTLFGPTWSEDPVRIEPPGKEKKKRCRTVPRPACSEDLARSAEPLDTKRDTMFWPKSIEDHSRSTKPDKHDKERCCAVSEPERSEDLACSAEPPEEDKKHGPKETESDKRIITKRELYRDPDLFQSRIEYVEPIAPQPKKPKPWGYYDWTRQIWVHKDTGKRVPMNKREELDEEQRQAWGEAWREERRGEWRGMRGGSQPGHPLAEPPRVQSGLAENMKQKVGWPGGDAPRFVTQGGALGRVGEPIHHPTTTDPNNTSCNTGFGKRISAKSRPKKLSARDVFRTNVLLFIMDFVKDDTEVQLQFDSALQQCERRQIKTIVDNIITAGNIELLGTVGQYDLVLDIERRNQYHISVVSEGDEVTRWLSLYKEAPGHVYLVTPDDFLPKEDDETDEQVENSINPGSRDDDDNPFLRSIEKGLKKKNEKQSNIVETEKRKDSTPEEKMLEFFLEFVDSEYYTEMWFLGKFNEKQVQVINDLLNDLSTCMDDLDSFDGEKEMAKVFKGGEVQFELKEGSNGTTEIHKVSPNPPTEEHGTQPGAQADP